MKQETIKINPRKKVTADIKIGIIKSVYKDKFSRKVEKFEADFEKFLVSLVLEEKKSLINWYKSLGDFYKPFVKTVSKVTVGISKCEGDTVDKYFTDFTVSIPVEVHHNGEKLKKLHLSKNQRSYFDRFTMNNYHARSVKLPVEIPVASYELIRYDDNYAVVTPDNDEFDELAKKLNKWVDDRAELESQVTGALSQIDTVLQNFYKLKELIDQFPEFLKYLPESVVGKTSSQITSIVPKDIYDSVKSLLS